MSCKTKNLDNMKRLAETKEFTRAKVCRHLQHSGGGLYYAAAPDDIPTDVLAAWYNGKEYPVLHLGLRICADGYVTDQIDWEGIHAGKYISGKGWAWVTVAHEISDYEARAPQSRLIHRRNGNQAVVKVRPIGNINRLFAWNRELEAIEIVDDKPTVSYYDSDDGKLRQYYPWRNDTGTKMTEAVIDAYKDATIDEVQPQMDAASAVVSEEVAKIALENIKRFFPHLL